MDKGSIIANILTNMANSDFNFDLLIKISRFIHKDNCLYELCKNWDVAEEEYKPYFEKMILRNVSKR